MVKRYTEAAVKFIKTNQDKPFFIYLPHNAVHFPLYPGKEFQKKSANGLYGDWVEEVDWSVGQLLDTLRELKLSEKTIVIFTSDNGGTPRAVNAPLRGFKGSTLEGGMRVPTIAWCPGRIPAGTATDAITGMIDVLPTFVKLAGGKLPTDRKLDGGDIWPLLAGEAGAKSPHEVFYYIHGLNLQAVRTGPWKLHLAKGELYNLADDIGESKNVAAAHPDEVKRLQALADAMKDDLGVTGMGPGVRPLGRASNAQPLMDRSGTIREGFAPK
jgi:arylsulfatase A